MGDGTNRAADEAAYLACQRIVQDLIAKFQWTLLDPDKLVELVLHSTSERSNVEMSKWAKYHYTIALYEACRQTQDGDRCEQGYGELHRLLYRAAYNHRPEVAEDATQSALTTIFEQIDRCRSPGAFIAFALFKLRAAIKQEVTAEGRDLYLEEVTSHPAETEHVTPESSLEQQELCQALLRSITSLPNERQQQAILLKYLSGLSDKEIAERLGTTERNVRVLRHRGIEKLGQDGRLQEHAWSPEN